MYRAPVSALLLVCLMLSATSAIQVPDRVPPPAVKPGSGQASTPDLTSVFFPVSIGNPKKTYKITALALLSEIPFFTKFDKDENKFLNEEESASIFTDLDKNGDGLLDQLELANNNMQTLICAGDDNKDGVLNREEFENLLNSMDLNDKNGIYVGEVYAYLKYHKCLED